MIVKDIKSLFVAACCVCCGVVAAVSTVSCTDDPNEGELFVRTTNDKADLSVADVLSAQPSTYSLWVEMLKYSNYYNALKDAKSTSTAFCPNNDAVRKFLSERGVNSVEELSQSYVKDVVQVHLIYNNLYKLSEIDTAAVNGETLRRQTLFGTYLKMSYGYTITDVDDAELTGEVHCADSIFINNQAGLAKYAVDTCSNGFIYELNNVIHPLSENITEKLELYGNYQIYCQAIRANRQVDSLYSLVRDTTVASDGSKVVSRHSFTCFAVPDKVYHAAGISSVDDLKTWLVNNSNGEETDGDAALYHYMMYHLTPIQYETKSLFNFQTDGETLIYDTYYSGQAFITNMDNGRKVINKDIHILRSDIEAANGRINKVDGIMPVYHPEPVNVKWDFLNSADIIAAVNAWGAARGDGDVFDNDLASSEKKFDLSDDHRSGDYGTMSSFTYNFTESSTNLNSYNKVGFVKEKYISSSRKSETPHGSYMNNYMVLNLGYAGWIKFTTPTIVAGRYKVVLHYIKNTQTQRNLYASGTMTRFNLDELQSFNYLYKGQSTSVLYGQVETTLWNEVTFDTSSTHEFTITLMDIQAKTLKGYHLRLDYVEFIPLND